MNKNKTIVISIILVSFAAVIGWLAWLGSDQENMQTESTNKKERGSSTTPTVENWKVYKNDKYGFEFNYPKEWFTYERTNGEKRIYIQTVPGETDKETSPADFKRLWIAYDSEEGEEISSNLSGASKYVVANNGIEMNYYEWPADAINGEPAIEAYWDRDNIKFKADCASEVGAENAKQEVEVLKKIISTFKFTK